jgi:hypothetical protein
MWLLKDTTKYQEDALAKLITPTKFEYEFQDVNTADLISWPKHHCTQCYRLVQ